MTNQNLEQLIERYTDYGVPVGTLPTAHGMKREEKELPYICNKCGHREHPMAVDRDGGLCEECGEGEMYRALEQAKETK